MIQLPEIQYITRDHATCDHAEQAGLMFENGISWVQIRMKKAKREEVIAQASKAVEYANKFGGKLIINDSIDIALETKAHGVHLGLTDMPVDKAREYLGDEMIIGGTANTIDQVILQIERGADYVGVGPFRFTTTKENLSPVLGLKGYSSIINELKNREISTPLVAVGGILLDEIPTIIETGIKGVAISGALLNEYIK